MIPEARPPARSITFFANLFEKSSQVKSSQVKSSQVKSSHLRPCRHLRPLPSTTAGLRSTFDRLPYGCLLFMYRLDLTFEKGSVESTHTKVSCERGTSVCARFLVRERGQQGVSRCGCVFPETTHSRFSDDVSDPTRPRPDPDRGHSEVSPTPTPREAGSGGFPIRFGVFSYTISILMYRDDDLTC